MPSRRDFLQTAVMGTAALPLASLVLKRPPAAAGRKPNLVFILADDGGYGDFGCYGATKIKTPNIDRLAVQGVRFTDAYAPNATCTPTRYSILTGEYAWRKPGTGILPGDAALIIEPGRPTLPALMKKAGYATGAVGKWHLGLGDGRLDWNGEIEPGPLEIGFDYFFGMPATGDRVPCVYIENRRVVNLDPADPIQVDYKTPVGDDPTGKTHPERLKMELSAGHDGTIINGISRIGFMSGGKAARWTDEDMAATFTRKAVEFIEKHKDGPFFLYFGTHDPHVPRVPHPRFRGTSGCGVRGDVIQEFDGSVGEVTAVLDRLGLAGDTLLIVTSDNGGVINDGYDDGADRDINGHRPNGPLGPVNTSLTRAASASRFSPAGRGGSSQARSRNRSSAWSIWPRQARPWPERPFPSRPPRTASIACQPSPTVRSLPGRPSSLRDARSARATGSMS